MVARTNTREMLRTEQITVQFEGLKALDQVDLELSRGEILGLIGPNGAGKTTLVNVISGFQRPTAGLVRKADVEISAMPPHRVAREGVARSFQGSRPFAGLTVDENVRVAALGAGRSPQEAKELAESLLSRIGLTGRADDQAGSLPYGDQRKVGVARALATGPDFMLLDEPAAGLNESEADELARAVKGIRDDFGCGLLVIEHDMRFVMGLCDRLHVLDHGKTIGMGTPEEVRSNPKVIEAYLGSSAE
jgi:branched-chain amino acid transport system ATP-binding protein